MTIEQAKEILKRPKFGDPQQLEALQRLRDAGKEEELRARLLGKVMLCSECGMGNRTKKCWQCGGEAVAVTKQLLESWDLNILEGVAEDIEER